MLVLEDSDEDRLYLAKGVPRDWVVSGKEVSIDGAPTRWGRVTLKMMSNRSTKTITARIVLAKSGSPKETHLKLRLPVENTLQTVTVNGKPATMGGVHKDTVIIPTGADRHFEVTARWA